MNEKSMLKDALKSIIKNKVSFLLEITLFITFLILTTTLLTQYQTLGSIPVILISFIYGFLGPIVLILSVGLIKLNSYFASITLSLCAYLSIIFLKKLFKSKKLLFYYLLSLIIVIFFLLTIYISGNEVIHSSSTSLTTENQILEVKNILNWEIIDMDNTYNKSLLYDLERFPYTPFFCKGIGYVPFDATWTAVTKCGACGEYTALFLGMSKELNITAKQIVNYGLDHTWAEVKINDEWVPIETTQGISGYNHSDVHDFYNCTETKKFLYVLSIDSEGGQQDVTEKYLCPNDIGRLIIHAPMGTKITIEFPYVPPNKYELVNYTDSDNTYEAKIGNGNYTIIAEKELFLFLGLKSEKMVRLEGVNETYIYPTDISLIVPDLTHLTLLLLGILIGLIIAFILMRKKLKQVSVR